jgi:iron complex outermembrane receptor protein
VLIRSSVDLPSQVRLDWMLRRVSALPALNVAAYASSDVHVSWTMTPSVELFVTGRNLHDAHHREFPSTDQGDAEVRRTLLAGVRWTR